MGGAGRTAPNHGGMPNAHESVRMGTERQKKRSRDNVDIILSFRVGD